ncbi:MAG: hypothetical protein JO277_06955 [Candidatus Eremiobacteraeota bacterium]|nr:hypothetical protein [Candidatus Eremiobacteraeota bacterium]
MLTGRLRAYAYGLVTTILFLVFAVTESLTEGYVAQHSRVAGTLIEIAIVVVLALLFRPLHNRVDGWIEHAFTKRRKEARDALARLRKELTSFNDTAQILRRVVEAVDHTMGTGGSAIYLRHGIYDAEASTFDAAAASVEPSDALVVRLRSSAAPANPRALESSALGELAFPMMAGGELVGFLTLAPKRVECDAEDRCALSALAESTGVALLALDGRLRERQRHTSSKPNNLPRQSTSFVGRSHEVAAVADMVRAHPLVTVAGAGGMGKTRLALQVAERLLDETTEGAWFVDLAPIGDGSLIPSTILSVLGADQSGDAPPIERLVTFLAPRAMLLILDNSEHLVSDIARVVDALIARCPSVAVLATSREPLGLKGENVHRIASLDEENAVQLFLERARAVNDRFELTPSSRPAVEEICRRLDGMALAIELAAARVRSISVDELSHRLQLRVLGRSGGEPVARHQTMHALVDWSFDLLTEREQQSFLRFSPFVGGFTLAAAAAYYGEELDEWELLDVVTSLVDKSLLVADVEESSQRYRFLEPIREYARERLERNGEAGAALDRYARTFAALADEAYEEFDAGPKPDWLTRNARELDNVRASLRWALDAVERRELSARLAGSFGVVFLRLTLLQEGIEWCNRAASNDAPLTPAVRARLYYVLSMLSNNQGAYAEALASSQAALKAYQTISDARGTARALSQVAQQYENTGRPEEASEAGDRAVAAARTLDDRGVLAAVLARTGNAFQAHEIEKARNRYEESAELFRDLEREAERSRVLCWWADAEFKAGNAELAGRLAGEARATARDDLRIAVAGIAAKVYWASGERERAISFSREALQLASDVHDDVHLPDAIFCVAILASESDAAEAARLLGYAQPRNQRFQADAGPSERRLWNQFEERLRTALGDLQFEALRAEGASWSEERAVRVASAF